MGDFVILPMLSTLEELLRKILPKKSVDCVFDDSPKGKAAYLKNMDSADKLFKSDSPEAIWDLYMLSKKKTKKAYLLLKGKDGLEDNLSSPEEKKVLSAVTAELHKHYTWATGTFEE